MRVLLLHTNPYNQEIEDLISDLYSYMSDTDIHCYEYPYNGFKFRNLLKLIKFRFYIRKNKIDIIHAYHFREAFYAKLVSMFTGVKVVYSCYSYHDELKKHNRRIFNFVLSKADAIIFQTEVQKNRFISKYNLQEEKCFKLFHAFSLQRLDNFKFTSIRDEFFIDGYKYLLGTASEFTPEYHLLNIFKMVRKLRKSGRNFICIVAGDNIEEHEDYYDECKYYYISQGLENYICYSLHRPDMTNYISQLDVFIHHSENEAISLPIIMAMMLGVPVVVNDCEMIREITFNGKYATMYDADDIDDFTQKTRQVLLDMEDYELMTEIVKEECRAIFDIRKHIMNLKYIYYNIINQDVDNGK